MVREILYPSPGNIPFRVETVVATGDWLGSNRESIHRGIETIEVRPEELRQVSTQQEPNRVIALVHQADYRPDITVLQENLTLGLENIQDPGNLGSIIRIADWFGIRDILCSGDCVELYNPKVIQSTMGSFLRVRVHTLDLPELIGRVRSDFKPQGQTGTVDKKMTGDAGNDTGSDGYRVFGTGSLGDNVFDGSLPERGMILLGNESRGLSGPLLQCSDRVLSIPWQDSSMHPDSLNVAAAAAILCAEFRRQAYSK